MVKGTGVGFAGLVVVNIAFVYLVIPVIEGQKNRRALQMEMRTTLDEVGAPGNAAKVARLLDRGADIRTVGYSGVTVAMVAAWWNDPVLLKRALDAGADPNAADRHGSTALIAATFGPGDDCTRLLLVAGADPNRARADGDTALLWAVRNARHDLIPLLRSAGAKADAANVRGETPLAVAKGLTHGGPRPMRPDLTAADFVRLLGGE